MKLLITLSLLIIFFSCKEVDDVKEVLFELNLDSLEPPLNKIRFGSFQFLDNELIALTNKNTLIRLSDRGEYEIIIDFGGIQRSLNRKSELYTQGMAEDFFLYEDFLFVRFLGTSSLRKYSMENLSSFNEILLPKIDSLNFLNHYAFFPSLGNQSGINYLLSTSNSNIYLLYDFNLINNLSEKIRSDSLPLTFGPLKALNWQNQNIVLKSKKIELISFMDTSGVTDLILNIFDESQYESGFDIFEEYVSPLIINGDFIVNQSVGNLKEFIIIVNQITDQSNKDVPQTYFIFVFRNNKLSLYKLDNLFSVKLNNYNQVLIHDISNSVKTIKLYTFQEFLNQLLKD